MYKRIFFTLAVGAIMFSAVGCEDGGGVEDVAEAFARGLVDFFKKWPCGL